MPREFSQTSKDKMSASCRDSWKDPTKRVEQKKRAAAKRLLKDVVPDRIESPSPLNIETSRQAIIDEIKKLDDQMAKFESLVQRREIMNFISFETKDRHRGMFPVSTDITLKLIGCTGFYTRSKS